MSITRSLVDLDGPGADPQRPFPLRGYLYQAKTDVGSGAVSAGENSDAVSPKPHFDVVVVISNATGLLAEQYRHFAEFLVSSAQQNHGKILAVLTWDYRSMGLSRPEQMQKPEWIKLTTSAAASPHGGPISCRTWIHDMEAVLDFASKSFPAVQTSGNLVHIGHCLGSVMLPVTKNSQDVLGRAISMSAQSAYFGFSGWKLGNVMGMGGVDGAKLEKQGETEAKAQTAKAQSAKTPQTQPQKKKRAKRSTRDAYKTFSKEFMYTLWKAVVPLSCMRNGYFDGKAFGLALDLPRYAVTSSPNGPDHHSWGQWSLNPGYVLDRDAYPEHRKRYERFDRKTLAIFAWDDEFFRVGVERLRKEVIGKRNQRTQGKGTAGEASRAAGAASLVTTHAIPLAAVPPEIAAIHFPLGSFKQKRVQFLVLASQETIGHNGWLLMRDEMRDVLWEKRMLNFVCEGEFGAEFGEYQVQAKL